MLWTIVLLRNVKPGILAHLQSQHLSWGGARNGKFKVIFQLQSEFEASLGYMKPCPCNMQGRSSHSTGWDKACEVHTSASETLP